MRTGHMMSAAHTHTLLCDHTAEHHLLVRASGGEEVSGPGEAHTGGRTLKTHHHYETIRNEEYK